VSQLVRDGRDVMGAGLERWATGRCDPPRDGFLPRVAARLGVVVPPLDLVAPVEPVPAVVDYGRWCAQCPCGGAEMVWLEGPHQMWCARCGNADILAQWRPVVLPDRVHEIILALEARPFVKDRNWRPGQTVADLWAWNEEHVRLLAPAASAGGDP